MWAPLVNKDGKSQHHWDRMDEVQSGDLVVNYSGGQIRAISTALTRARPAMNSYDGSTGSEWENEGREIKLKMQELDVTLPLSDIPEDLRMSWKEAGSPFNKKGGINQGYLFNLPEEAGLWLMNELNLVASTADDLLDTVPDVNDDDVDTVIVVGPDGDITVKFRAEHAQLKKYLFASKKESNCALCGKVLPTELLVTSHIKKRAECNDGERMDKRIVMAACALGCDAVYERGYIKVSQQGIIEQGHKSAPTDDLSSFVDTLVGKKVSAFAPHTAKYFAWHSKWHAPKA